MSTLGIEGKRLESSLRSIGWKLKPVGGGHYRLVNPQGKLTGWQVYDGKLEFRWDDNASGLVYFNLERCSYEVEADSVTLVVGGYESFVSFYNFK